MSPGRAVFYSREEAGHACMDIWRLPGGLPSAGGTDLATTAAECSPNTPQLAVLELCCAVSLLRGI